MTADLEKLEAMQKQAYFESKLKMVPASIKDIYSAVSGEDILVARELVVDGHVVIGIEYAPNGEVASAYTTDKTGKRVTLDLPKENTAQDKSHASKDLISERLNEAAKTITRNEKAVESVRTVSIKDKKTNRATTSKDIRTLREMRNSKRQNA